MELVAITESGAPARPIGALPELPAEVAAATAELYGSEGFSPPWIGYLAIADIDEEEGVCVGACAFKSPPRDRRVEIAYTTFPGYEGRGLATAMAAALLELARGADASVTPFAQTLPEPSASTRVLEKLGFCRAREVQHPEDGRVWEWELAIVAAHEHSSRHREELQASERCGCFYCCAIFSPADLASWLPGGDTASCPRCGIDSVIGEASGYPISAGFLARMRAYWFW